MKNNRHFLEKYDPTERLPIMLHRTVYEHFEEHGVDMSNYRIIESLLLPFENRSVAATVYGR